MKIHLHSMIAILIWSITMALLVFCFLNAKGKKKGAINRYQPNVLNSQINAGGGPAYHVQSSVDITGEHPRAGRRPCPLLSYIPKKKTTLTRKLKTNEGESHAPRRHSRPLITHRFGIRSTTKTEISKQKIVVATGNPSPQLRAVSRKQQQDKHTVYNATV